MSDKIQFYAIETIEKIDNIKKIFYRIKFPDKKKSGDQI